MTVVVCQFSDDSLSDETLNRNPLALLLRGQYEFPFGINIVQLSLLDPICYMERVSDLVCVCVFPVIPVR